MAALFSKTFHLVCSSTSLIPNMKNTEKVGEWFKACTCFGSTLFTNFPFGLLFIMEHTISFFKVQIIKRLQDTASRKVWELIEKQHIPHFLFLFHVLLYYYDNTYELRVATKERGRIDNKKAHVRMHVIFFEPIIYSSQCGKEFS